MLEALKKRYEAQVAEGIAIVNVYLKHPVGIKFATPADARKTVAKVKKISKPFARKIQILTVGEQRAKVMGKSQVAAIFKRGKNAIRRTRNTK